jgi:2-polyprenyl-3-methyl-5-hydroxy-6-metoxy-1,4-benzoquinol methylase
LLEDHAIENENKYDVVCSFQVLEHIANPRSYLINSLKVLKDGGKLIIAVPNNNPYIFKHDILHTLNLPPHHAGLWNKESFENIPKFFPLELVAAIIEPLSEYKEWFQVQVEYLKNQKHFSGTLLSMLPRPLYKGILRLFRKSIEGRNIIVVFSKTNAATK